MKSQRQADEVIHPQARNVGEYITSNAEIRRDDADSCDAGAEIVIAGIQFDEFICGYRGRLGALNQFANETKFMAKLRRHVHPEIAGDYPASGTLARASGLDLTEFVRNHTMLSLHRAVTPHDPQISHGDPARLDIINYFGTRLFRQEARICPECVEQDRGHGIPYWRRSHQLPGIYWCQTHGKELLVSAGGKYGFRKMPHWVDTLPRHYADSQIAEIRENPAVRRYVDILKGLMDATTSVNNLHADYRIRQLAKQRKFRTGVDGKKRTLSDIIQPLFPHEWLTRQYPAMVDRKPGEYCSVVDSVTMCRSPVPIYALALAGLFETSKEALSFWYGDDSTMPSERKKRLRGCDSWPRKTMLDAYVTHAGNHRKIGETLQLAPTKTRAMLCGAGLPALGNVDLQTSGQAVLDFANGMALSEACSSNHATTDEVEAVIRASIYSLSNALQAIMHSSLGSRTNETESSNSEASQKSPTSSRTDEEAEPNAMPLVA